ncbi:MAG: CBS domain-containing protein [Pseudomonadota bacterium]
MRAPTNYAGPRASTKSDDAEMSQTELSALPAGPATIQTVLDTKGNKIVSVAATDTMQTAVNLLREHRIGALLVLTSSGELEGILSERDIVRKLAEIPGHVLKQTVQALMTTKVTSCSPDDPLLNVLKAMTEGRFRHMPVMKDGHLLGIVTIGDVVHARLRELELQTVKMQSMIVG